MPARKCLKVPLEEPSNLVLELRRPYLPSGLGKQSRIKVLRRNLKDVNVVRAHQLPVRPVGNPTIPATQPNFRCPGIHEVPVFGRRAPHLLKNPNQCLPLGQEPG